MITRKYKILILAALLFLANGALKAQKTDTIDNRSQRILQFLDINMNEEKSMLKFSPDYLLSSNFNYLSLYLSYETKIKKQFSFAVNNNCYFDLIQKNPNFSGGRESSRLEFYNSTGVSFRYYFTLARRMREGVSGNNLNGLYTEFELLNLVNLYDKGIYKNFIDKSIIDVPDPKISVGLQKRLNRWSYVDVYASFQYYREAFVSNLGFRIGIAL